MSNPITKLRGFSLALALAALCSAPSTHADTLGTTGSAVGSQSFTLSIGGSTSAGGFAGTWNAAAIVFWCIELDQFFNPGDSYTDYTASIPDNAIFTMLGQLFTEVGNAATSSASNSAAFQLAIWEIVYDGDLSLSAGTFQVTSGNMTTRNQAQSWLDHLGDFTDNYNIVLLHSASRQDFITFGEPFTHLRVPEPGSLALLGIALVGMLGVTRRRRTA